MSQAWDRFFFDERPAPPLRVFRGIFGAWLVTYYLRLYDILHLHYGRNGIVHADEVRARMQLLWTNPLAWFAGSEIAFQMLFALTVAAAVLLAVGWTVRVAAFLTWALNLCWFDPLIAGNNSADGIVTIHAFLFLVAAAASHLDASRVAAPAWSVRLFQLQLALLYFFSGWHKAGSAEWNRGEAMHYVFQQTAWTRVNFSLVDGPLLVGVVTYGTMFFELVIFPVLVWPRATRTLVLASGVAFHLSIALTMKVFTFGEILPIAYLAFLEADSRLIRLLAGWTERIRAAASGSIPLLRAPG